MSGRNFEELACCHEGCGEIIVVHKAVANRWRETHEWFYCPAGHRQHFTGKTEAERVREELQEKIDRLERWLDSAQEWHEETREEFATCPYPLCPQSDYQYASRQNLGRHLAKYHGGSYPVYPDTEDEAVAS